MRIRKLKKEELLGFCVFTSSYIGSVFCSDVSVNTSECMMLHVTRLCRIQ